MSIKPANMFVTPDNMKDLEDRIESFSGGEKAAAWMGAMMVLVKPSVKTEGKWSREASFAYMFDYDQYPDEIIYDYGVNEISEAWATDYESTRLEAA